MDLQFSVPPSFRRASLPGCAMGGAIFPPWLGEEPGPTGRRASFQVAMMGRSCLLPQVRIDCLNRQWTSSLVLGVITCPPERLNFPASACALKRAAWLLRGRGIFHNGLKVGGRSEKGVGQASE